MQKENEENAQPIDFFRTNDYLALDRTILANERTLLAYLRTFVALAASGVGLIKLFDTRIFFAVGIVFIVGGFAALVVGLRRFIIVREKMKEAYLTGHVKKDIL